MPLFSSGAKNTFTGVALVIVSVIFLLSGLGVFRFGVIRENYIISSSADILIAFVLLAIGLAYIYSEVGEPGKQDG